VREDYSPGGSAWDYFPHDQARSRAYRWGEDGILGISDDQQLLCFAIALWNGEDDTLKERLFGLTGQEGNHGEDVKEYYFYLDSTPTHSYMKALYKYPHRKFPYRNIVEETQSRSRRDPEFELLETDIFAENRYFDVFVEYAKASPEDIHTIPLALIDPALAKAQLDVITREWYMHPNGKLPAYEWAFGDSHPQMPGRPGGSTKLGKKCMAEAIANFWSGCSKSCC
jgi:hypothetical protein